MTEAFDDVLGRPRLAADNDVRYANSLYHMIDNAQIPTHQPIFPESSVARYARQGQVLPNEAYEMFIGVSMGAKGAIAPS